MAELADALDSKSSGATRAGSSPASGMGLLKAEIFRKEHPGKGALFVVIRC